MIDECDYYVLIIGARYGSVDQAGLSFTEKEYDYAVKQNKTVLAFIHGEPASIPVSKVDIDQALATKLEAFRKNVSTGRLVRFWKGTDDLELKITKALAKAVTDMPGIGWVRGNVVASEDLLIRINNLHQAVEKLTAEKEELSAELAKWTTPRVNGLADLSEVFKVRYHFQKWTGTIYADHHGSSNLRWAQIFAAVGPQFYRPANPTLIGHALMNYVQENENIKPFNMRIFSSDENQIKIHLMALDLIEIKSAEATGGGISEFASLTPKGAKQLLELLALRGTLPAGTT